MTEADAFSVVHPTVSQHQRQLKALTPTWKVTQ